MGVEELYSAAAIAGAFIVGLGAVIGSVVQIRAWIREPFQKLEAAISGVRAAQELSSSAMSARVNNLTTEIQTLQVHFDGNGGNLRGRIATIEQKISSLEVNGSAERSELRGLIVDLRPILHELRERP
jgi:hypothetical protein